MSRHQIQSGLHDDDINSFYPAFSSSKPEESKQSEPTEKMQDDDTE